MPYDTPNVPHSVLSPRLAGLWHRLERARRDLEVAEAQVIANSALYLARTRPGMEGHPLLLEHESCAMTYEQITREFFYQLRQEVPMVWPEALDHALNDEA